MNVTMRIGIPGRGFGSKKRGADRKKTDKNSV
jgi:hypothetical protein